MGPVRHVFSWLDVISLERSAPGSPPGDPISCAECKAVPDGVRDCSQANVWGDKFPENWESAISCHMLQHNCKKKVYRFHGVMGINRASTSMDVTIWWLHYLISTQPHMISQYCLINIH